MSVIPENPLKNYTVYAKNKNFLKKQNGRIEYALEPTAKENQCIL